MKATWDLAALLCCCAVVTSAIAAGGAPARRSEVYKKWPFNAAEAKRRQQETAKALGVAVEDTIDLGGGVKLTLVLIPAGEFLMGSAQSPAEVARLAARDPDDAKYFQDEHPQHRVTVTKAFWLGKHEVTQEQWQAVMADNPSHFKGARNPVEHVSWNDCQEFLRRLNARVRGGRFTLPTEAQWEYACRAGTATPFYFGQTITTDRVNYDGDYPYAGGRKGIDREKTMPVGTFPANAWGLHDLHGNVYEWCQDWYGDYAAGAQKDPTGPADGKYRVLRGGSWDSGASDCRSAYRDLGTPDHRSHDVGVRIARPLP